MAILATRGDRTVLVLRREGPQPHFDLAGIAKEIARGQANAKPTRVLFDWSAVTVWPFEAPGAAAIRYWYTLAPRVARAALIHDEKCDRHAAMLAALMRALGAEAKAFPPGYQERAVAWLEAPLAPGVGRKAPAPLPRRRLTPLGLPSIRHDFDGFPGSIRGARGALSQFSKMR